MLESRCTLVAANSLRVCELRPWFDFTIVTPFDTAYQHKSHAICTADGAYAVARLVAGAGEFDHVTPVLRDDLHWLPVHQRIQLKVALTAFDCVRGSGPAYFKDVCIPLADICIDCSRSNLRSAQRGDMVVPRTRTQLGRQSFHVAAPVVWNALPVYLHSSSIS